MDIISQLLSIKTFNVLTEVVEPVPPDGRVRHEALDAGPVERRLLCHREGGEVARPRPASRASRQALGQVGVGQAEPEYDRQLDLVSLGGPWEALPGHGVGEVLAHAGGD